MKKLALAALASLALALPAAAQQRPSFGVGVGVVATEALFNLSPTIEVYLPLNVGPTLRLEPSAGVFTNDQRAGGVDSSNVTLGLGVFYLAKVAEPTDVYAGGRVKLTFVSADNGALQDDETDWTIAAAVGGEHYLSPRFSLGAEAQLGHYQNGRLSATIRPNDNGFFTAGIAFVRFYVR